MHTPPPTPGVGRGRDGGQTLEAHQDKQPQRTEQGHQGRHQSTATALKTHARDSHTPHASSRGGDVAATSSLADIHHQRGFALRKQGMFEAALAEYRTALQHDPGHFGALFNSAFALDRLRRHAEAVQFYTKALAVNSDNPYAYYNRGISYDRGGDYEKAIADFQRLFRFCLTMQTFIITWAFVIGNAPPGLQGRDSVLLSRPGIKPTALQSCLQPCLFL